MGSECTRIVTSFIDLLACFNSSFYETKIPPSICIILSWLPNPHAPQNNFQHDVTGICSSALTEEVAVERTEIHKRFFFVWLFITDV
jgi:hypothetical protein